MLTRPGNLVPFPFRTCRCSNYLSDFHEAFATGAASQQERSPFRTPGSVPPFWDLLACAPIVETRFLELAMSLLDFSPWITLGTFSILLGSASLKFIMCSGQSQGTSFFAFQLQCCGVNAIPAGSSGDFDGSYWHRSGAHGSQKIPTSCCKSATATNYTASTQCKDNVVAGTYWDKVVSLR